MIKHFLIFAIILSPLAAKKTFYKEHILQYMTKENPYFYKMIGEIYIREAEEKFARGALDTQINTRYDDKKYPTTSGTYQYADITKPLLNGMELSLAYRNAQGVQEYNNIVTGKNGEMLAGVKIPVFSLLNNMSKNMVDIGLSKLNTKYDKETSRVNINTLYLNIFQAYYQILLYKEIYGTEEELFEKAKKNKRFISRHIEIGKLPPIALAEMESLEIQRKQRLLYAKNAYENAKNTFLQYLGIPKSIFDKKFKLPSLSHNLPYVLSQEIALKKALDNRSELKQINYQEKKNSLNKEFNTLEKYPKFNVGLYGSHDFQYNEGYKVTFDLSMPIERRRYQGRNEALQKNALLLESRKATLIREITTQINNILQKMRMIKETISLSKQEISLAKKVEKAEHKKFEEGVSTLIFLNQREMNTLYTKQKLLNYYYELLILKINLDFQMGIESKRLTLNEERS